jgi:hypothetical protein
VAVVCTGISIVRAWNVCGAYAYFGVAGDVTCEIGGWTTGNDIGGGSEYVGSGAKVGGGAEFSEALAGLASRYRSGLSLRSSLSKKPDILLLV